MKLRRFYLPKCSFDTMVDYQDEARTLAFPMSTFPILKTDQEILVIEPGRLRELLEYACRFVIPDVNWGGSFNQMNAICQRIGDPEFQKWMKRFND